MSAPELHEPDADWLVLLREACKGSSQVAVGKRIGYSGGAISAVLSGTYKGNLQSLQSAVEGALMGATVECPVLGELPRNQCLGYQRRRFAATNPTRVALSAACPRCTHSVANSGKESS